MALYSVIKKGVGIQGLVSRHRISQGTGTFTERFLLFDCLSRLVFVIFQSSCIGFKSRESPGHSKPGHSKTNISLFLIMNFVDLG